MRALGSFFWHLIRWRFSARYNSEQRSKCVISGFRRETDENSRVLWVSKTGSIGCLQTSVRNCHSSSRNKPKQRSSQGPECFTNEIFCKTPVSLACLDAAQLSKSIHSSWIKIDQLDVTCFIISLFNAQHVSNASTSILRSLRLIC